MPSRSARGLYKSKTTAPKRRSSDSKVCPGGCFSSPNIEATFVSPLDKLELIQNLHLWKATKISAAMAQFLYAGRFSVSIPSVNFVPIVSRVTIDRLPIPGQRQDPFPALSDLTLQTAVKWVRSMGDATTNREVSNLFWHPHEKDL